MDTGGECPSSMSRKHRGPGVGALSGRTWEEQAHVSRLQVHPSSRGAQCAFLVLQIEPLSLSLVLMHAAPFQGGSLCEAVCQGSFVTGISHPVE